MRAARTLYRAEPIFETHPKGNTVFESLAMAGNADMFGKPPSLFGIQERV